MAEDDLVATELVGAGLVFFLFTKDSRISLPGSCLNTLRTVELVLYNRCGVCDSYSDLGLPRSRLNIWPDSGFGCTIRSPCLTEWGASSGEFLPLL
jgi:hypothetical protein